MAFEATRLTHGEDKAREAQETARARFRGEGADAGPSFAMPTPLSIEQLAVSSGLVKSLSEAKRLIAQNGIRIDGQPAARDRVIEQRDLPLLLSVGKRSVRIVAA